MGEYLATYIHEVNQTIRGPGLEYAGTVAKNYAAANKLRLLSVEVITPHLPAPLTDDAAGA